MRREQLIQNKASKMIALANAIMQDYKAEGYETQELEVKDDGHGNKGYIVQIRNTSENAGGFLKKIIGWENCASLVLTAKGNDLEVKVAGGKWLDKAAVIGVSMIVLWPLLITGTIGSFRPKALLDKLFMNAFEKLASDRV